MRNIIKVLPVFVAFYCMGFVDIVGTAVNLVKEDMALNATTMQFLASMIFIWFGIFSIPTGILQERIGKKKTVIISLLITTIAMLIPFVLYNYYVILISFALIGIGNTILQVSLNPLLFDVSSKGSYASNMSFSQFIKSVAGFFGPLITVMIFAERLGDWKYIFLAYGSLSILSMIWIAATPIKESVLKEKPASFANCFSLLNNRFVFLMVFGIFIVVGLDVGMNTGIPAFLEKYSLSSDTAVKNISLYIFALMASRFLGALILKKINADSFLIFSALLTIAGLFLLFLSGNILMAKTAIVLVGLGSANIFPLIFSISIERMPDRSNEIAGLMITAISGGAIFPLLMGIFTQNIGVKAGIVFLLFISLYLGIISFWNLSKNKP